MRALVSRFESTIFRAWLPALVGALLIAGCATQTPREQGKPGHGASRPAPAAAKQAPPSSAGINAASQRCLALTLYWEARGEGRLGMEAVGAVVLNRVADPRFPKTVCGVVYQGGETPPCQFSWWCDGRGDRPTQRAAWNASVALASQLLNGALRDPTHGALFFSRTSTRQPPQRVRTAQIGNHAFYR